MELILIIFAIVVYLAFRSIRSSEYHKGDDTYHDSLLSRKPVPPTADELARRSGEEAENFVATKLDMYARLSGQDFQTMKNALFVFNESKDNEFSAEADHILVTHKNIFLVETKFKSGRIRADAQSSEWKVEKGAAVESMRNALKQAKQTATIMCSNFTLPVKVIPIVAIYGNKVEIVDGPSNVVAAEEIGNVIRAFEDNATTSIPDPKIIISYLRLHCRSDALSIDKHILRAKLSQDRRLNAAVVSQASID